MKLSYSALRLVVGLAIADRTVWNPITSNAMINDNNPANANIHQLILTQQK